MPRINDDEPLPKNTNKKKKEHNNTKQNLIFIN